ncbi:MAG: AAA family ATPase [Actinomycetota bacterium]
MQPAGGDEAGLEGPDPLCSWQIPALIGGQTAALHAIPGQITVVVGPNGSGKSVLGYWLQMNASAPTVRRVIAHRRLWFEYAGPNITSDRRHILEQNMIQWGKQLDSRWRDHAQAERAGFVLFDLLAEMNAYNGRVVELLQQRVDPDHIWETVGTSLLERINTLFANAHLGLTLTITDRASFQASKGEGTVTYPISEMSDGEKSALLLAAEVMTAPDASLVIIDEPERHLHRLISASLIEAISADRRDCHFVVFTHDLDLAASLPRYSTVVAVLAETAWVDGQPVGWDLRLLDPEADIPESARQAILGGRKEVLFLEGERYSLDVRLYGLLFPGSTLLPVGSCDQVIRAVAGLLASETYHWVHGRGIVDGDGRDAQERAALSTKGILSLAVSEVESLYYSEVVRSALAVRQAETLGKLAGELLEASTKEGLAAVRRGDTPTRLASSVAEKIMSRRLVEGLPTEAELVAGLDPINVSTPNPFPAQLAKLDRYLAADDLESVVREYPIRDTSLRAKVAQSLGFKTFEDYEAAAFTRIRSDAKLADSLRDLVGRLPEPATLPGT